MFHSSKTYVLFLVLIMIHCVFINSLTAPSTTSVEYNLPKYNTQAWKVGDKITFTLPMYQTVTGTVQSVQLFDGTHYFIDGSVPNEGWFSASYFEDSMNANINYQGNIQLELRPSLINKSTDITKKTYTMRYVNVNDEYILKENDLDTESTTVSPSSSPVTASASSLVKSYLRRIMAPRNKIFTKKIELQTTALKVLVLYTKQAVTTAGSESNLQATILLAVGNFNKANVNSNVDVSVDYVAERIQEYDTYTEDVSMSVMLNQMAGGTVSTARRYAVGAHAVQLVTSNTQYCGLAGYSYSGQTNGNSVTYHGCIGGYLSLAHEVGHSIGLHHDLSVYSGSGPNHGSCWDVSTSSGCRRSVMAYASCKTPTLRTNCDRVMYWSSPAISDSGNVVGDSTNCNNAQQLRDNIVRFTSLYTMSPVSQPTAAVVYPPSVAPTARPTFSPTVTPTITPTVTPTVAPTGAPIQPTSQPISPTIQPSLIAPTSNPITQIIPVTPVAPPPTASPVYNPTVVPSFVPSCVPSCVPTRSPTVKPTVVPTFIPSSAPTNTPTIAAVGVPVISYNYLGCYADSGTRAMTTRLNGVTSVAGCFDQAVAQIYKYFGLQYGGECWVSNDYASTTQYGVCGTNVQCTCSMKCSNGDICGAGMTNSLYEVTVSTPGATVVPTQKPSSVPTRVPTTAGVTMYTYLGCYADSSTRAMTLKLSGTFPSVSSCFNSAAAGNYKYFAMQYGSECWVSNDLILTEQYGVCGKLKSCACTMKCSSGEICGAGWANSLYRNDNAPDGLVTAPSIVEGGNGNSSVSKSTISAGLIAVIVISIVACLVLIGIVLLFRWKHQKNNNSNFRDENIRNNKKSRKGDRKSAKESLSEIYSSSGSTSLSNKFSDILSAATGVGGGAKKQTISSSNKHKSEERATRFRSYTNSGLLINPHEKRRSKGLKRDPANESGMSNMRQQEYSNNDDDYDDDDDSSDDDENDDSDHNHDESTKLVQPPSLFPPSSPSYPISRKTKLSPNTRPLVRSNSGAGISSPSSRSNPSTVFESLKGFLPGQRDPSTPSTKDYQPL